jgi:hypothetical protein
MRLTPITTIAIGIAILVVGFATVLRSRSPHGPTSVSSQLSKTNVLEELASTTFTDRIPDLGLSFSFPTAWGPPGSMTKNEDPTSCEYSANFRSNPYVGMCVISLDRAIAVVSANAIGNASFDGSIWRTDQHDLERLPVGAPCSRKSVPACVVLALKNGLKVLAYYAYPDSDIKFYTLYVKKYRVDFSIDLAGECRDKYPAVGCPAWPITATSAPLAVRTELTAFDQMLNSVAVASPSSTRKAVRNAVSATSSRFEFLDRFGYRDMDRLQRHPSSHMDRQGLRVTESQSADAPFLDIRTLGTGPHIRCSR